MTIHTAECLAEQTAIKETSDAWIARWPDYCTHCGAGGEWSTPMHVYRDGSADPPDGGLCAYCLEDGHCPRCGKDGWGSMADDEWSDEGPCSFCGWNHGQGEDDYMPPSGHDEGLCACEQAEYEAAYTAHVALESEAQA